MFDIELMRFNPEAPSFLLTLITALIAFFLSSLVAITYEYTTKSIYRRAHFIQSLALIGIVAAMILQAIGESVAIGLGIIGALSIIRFRTSLSDPRNITFMFASLGSGIACGVMAFGIAITGTLVFCLGSAIFRFSSFSDGNEFIGVLKLRVPKESDCQEIIENTLNKYCKNYELDQLRFPGQKKIDPVKHDETLATPVIEKEKVQEYTYLIRLKDTIKIKALEESIRNISSLDDFRISFQNKETKL